MFIAFFKSWKVLLIIFLSGIIAFAIVVWRRLDNALDYLLKKEDGIIQKDTHTLPKKDM
jgi:hypothetical protein